MIQFIFIKCIQNNLNDFSNDKYILFYCSKPTKKVIQNTFIYHILFGKLNR